MQVLSSKPGTFVGRFLDRDADRLRYIKYFEESRVAFREWAVFEALPIDFPAPHAVSMFPVGDGHCIVTEVWSDAPALDFTAVRCGDRATEYVRQAARLLANFHSASLGAIDAIVDSRIELNFSEPLTWRSVLTSQLIKWSSRLQCADDAVRLSIATIFEKLDILDIKYTDLAVIHGDFVWRNIVPLRPGCITLGVLDFETCLVGDPVYDLSKSCGLSWMDDLTLPKPLWQLIKKPLESL